MKGQNTAGNWVFVVDESNHFATKRNVRLGRKNPQSIEVISGLSPDEDVAINALDTAQER